MAIHDDRASRYSVDPDLNGQPPMLLRHYWARPTDKLCSEQNYGSIADILAASGIALTFGHAGDYATAYEVLCNPDGSQGSAPHLVAIPVYPTGCRGPLCDLGEIPALLAVFREAERQTE